MVPFGLFFKGLCIPKLIQGFIPKRSKFVLCWQLKGMHFGIHTVLELAEMHLSEDRFGMGFLVGGANEISDGAILVFLEG